MDQPTRFEKAQENLLRQRRQEKTVRQVGQNQRATTTITTTTTNFRNSKLGSEPRSKFDASFERRPASGWATTTSFINMENNNNNQPLRASIRRRFEYIRRVEKLRQRPGQLFATRPIRTPEEEEEEKEGEETPVHHSPSPSPTAKFKVWCVV